MSSYTATALGQIPLVRSGDDLPGLLQHALTNSALTLQDGDVLVLAQKIVSKAEGRQVALAEVQASPHALALAGETGKDPRIVELILRESATVLRHRPGVLIVEHRLGFVMANAGVDQSNIEHGADGEHALLLPLDPDASCRRLRDAIHQSFGVDVAVIINDSHGRAWRNGVVGVAIGAAGIAALWDRRGEQDLYGRRLQITEVGLADEIAAAASLLMGQADESRPIVLLRGLRRQPSDRGADALVRPRDIDLFR